MENALGQKAEHKLQPNLLKGKKAHQKISQVAQAKTAQALHFAKVIEALKNKVKEHNAKSKKKVTLSQLKKVYRRGAGAFSSSHRPGMSRGGWAMAR